MNSLFSTYLQLGYEHIADVAAYDHILFLIALCAVYRLGEWRNILILVTAFTIGHSLTLALAVLDIIRFPAAIVEFLIPVTIILTCLCNIAGPKEIKMGRAAIRWNYILALVFGTIHGMGFSTFLRSLMMPGEEGLLTQLLAFNIGVELGQILIVAIIMAITYVFLSVLKVKQREWVLFVSGGAMGIALMLSIETWAW